MGEGAGDYAEILEGHCHGCPDGKYQDSKGKTECIECKKGQFGDSNHDHGQKTTEAGHCSPCPKGQYQNQTGQTNTETYLEGDNNCIACPKGRYGVNTDAYTNMFQMDGGDEGAYGYAEIPKGHCHGCPDGKYQDAKGRTECIECEAGKYGVSEHLHGDKTTEADHCKPCPNGRYQ